MSTWVGTPELTTMYDTRKTRKSSSPSSFWTRAESPMLTSAEKASWAIMG